MKQFSFIVSFLSIFVIAACGSVSTDAPVVEGNGETTEHRFDVGMFSRIDIQGDASVVLMQGDTTNITLITDSNLIDYFDVAVDAGTLTITQPTASLAPTNGYLLNITTPMIDTLTVSGSNYVTANVLEAENFTITSSGDPRILLSSLNADTLTINASGAGLVQINGGRVESQDVTLSGAVNYDTGAMLSDVTLIESSSTGYMAIYAVNRLTGRLTSSGNLTYIGNPEIDVDTSGTGDVKAFQ